MIRILIEHGEKIYEPMVLDGAELSLERRGVCGKLSFRILKTKDMDLSCGDCVRLISDKANVFYGFVFTMKTTEKDEIEIVAYDQLRYLKNQDTYCYTDTASNLIKKIAKDFQLNVGEIEDTKYTIPYRIEDGSSLFDIIQEALDITLENTGNMYVLYDSFGKLTLKNISDLKVESIVKEDTAQSYEYTIDIDKTTANKVTLYFDNEATGQRDIFISQSGENINRWGVLQRYESIEAGENGRDKANKLLQIYNKESRSLHVNNVTGNIAVIGGSLIPCVLNLDNNTQINSYMMVESVKHIFKDGSHFMDLTLKGSIINE